MKLYGEGQYNLNSIKALRVSEDFLGMDESIKECQNKESFEECKSGRYIEKLLDECKCLPFGIQHLYKVNTKLKEFINSLTFFRKSHYVTRMTIALQR